MKAIGAAQNWDMHMQRASSNMNSYTVIQTKLYKQYSAMSIRKTICSLVVLIIKLLGLFFFYFNA